MRERLSLGSTLALALLLAGCDGGRDQVLAEKVAAAQAAADRAVRAAEAAEAAATAAGAKIAPTNFSEDDEPEVVVEDDETDGFDNPDSNAFDNRVDPATPEPAATASAAAPA